MKAAKINSFLKQFSIFLFAAVIVGCGSGGGGDNSGSGSNPDPVVAPDPDPDLGENSAITRDNFVAHSSAFYFASQHLQGVLALREVFELALLKITPVDKLYQIKDCRQSGDQIIDLSRVPADERKIHQQDSVTITQRSCVNVVGSRTGERTLTVTRLLGDYESDDYNISTTRVEHTTQSGSTDPDEDGDYNGRINSTSISKEGGDLFLFGVDVADLEAASPAEQGTHEFFDEVVDLAGAGIANPAFLELPRFHYDPISYEVISDERIENGEVLKYRWKYKIKDKKVPEHSFSTETTRQIIIAEKIRQDENGAEETFFVARDGEFEIKMDDGAVIKVIFNDPDASVAPGASPLPEAVATFDENGDGTIDVSKDLTYEEFVGAFFTLIVDVLEGV